MSSGEMTATQHEGKSTFLRQLLNTYMKTKHSRRTNQCHHGCPVEAALDVIGDKWKGIILYHLLNGPIRFNALMRLMPGISQRVLTLQLRELEEDQVIFRHIYPEIPPRVEYNLTERGKALKKILLALRDWGENFILTYRPT